MSPFRRSLRARLTIVGSVSIFVPVLVLLGTVAVTDEQEEVVVDGQTTVTDESSLSPWPIGMAALLATAGGGFAWWWAARTVEPLRRVREVAEDIEASDLGRRIGLEGAADEIQRLADAFDAMLERLENASVEQQRLIEDASHDLRTPLAILIGNADAVLTHPEPTSELYRDSLRRSGDAGRRLAAVIDELLVNARGRTRALHRHPVDFHALVRDVVERVRPLAAAKDVTLRLNPPETLPARLDEASVVRAVTNLLDNAVRHAPAGTAVEVDVGASQQNAWLSITDHGSGIDPDDAQHVFERPAPGAGSDARRGLGLPIARQVAQAHAGNVIIRSPGPSGDGCQVRLELRR